MEVLFEYVLILFIGFALDLTLGDPPYRLHPIRMIGNGIRMLEGFLRKCGFDGRAGGLVLCLIMEIVVLSVYIFLSNGLRVVHTFVGWAFDLFLFYSCLALRDLFHHIRPVIEALEQGNLPDARRAVAWVVGRDVTYLDMEGVIRAVIETLSENFVDGVLTPLFWFIIGGFIGYLLRFNPAISGVSLMLFAKVASTLDSMIGYKNPRYIRFGWAGAKLDDMIHFMPARVSFIILALGACLTGLEPLEGLRIGLRDRRKHDSPNAAHAESFVAGVLHVRLGGPTRYPEGIKEKPWLGEEYADPEIKHIRITERLVMASAWVFVIIIGLGIFLIKI
jgi:adenosylcobinamide-phosphate synthase